MVSAVATRRFLQGGGEMGALMRSMDWSATALGPVEGWPQSLRTSVSTCLNSRFPILIWWGPDLVKLYNDAYRPILGAKHPRSMGQAGRECWPEIWPIIGPMLQGVLERGEATWSENQLLLLERHGFAEECYFTFSYSPIRDESGGVAGVFCAVTETTGQVLAERRLRALRDLAACAAAAKGEDETWRSFAAPLQLDPEDLPFALLYRTSRDSRTAQLACAVGVEAGRRGAPEVVDISLVEEVRAILQTQPRLVRSGGQKVPEIMEVRVGGGTVEERLGYAKGLLGKEVRVTDFTREGTMVDVAAITKGKGWQGAVKRWGIKLLRHKNSKHRRNTGTLGSFQPGYVRPTVPQGGQMGFHQRTEYNKRVLRIGEDGKDITPAGGFLHYGVLKNEYVLLHGSIPGPTKRLVRLRDAARVSGVTLEEPPTLTYVSTHSKQGA